MILPSGVTFLYSDFDEFTGKEPVFFESTDYPSIASIEKAYPIIKAEIEKYIKGEVVIPAKNPNAPQVNYADSWQNAYFMNYMWEFPKTRKLFPETYRLLKSHPDITLAGIATLESKGRLFPHCGESNAIIRCHMGLKVPADLPECGLRVKDEKRGWTEGKVICFNDSYNHEAWNNSPEKRVILLFDIMKPEYMKHRVRVCAYSLGIASVRYLCEVTKIDRSIPLWLRKLFIWPFFLFWLAYIHTQNLLNSKKT